MAPATPAAARARILRLANTQPYTVGWREEMPRARLFVFFSVARRGRYAPSSREFA